MKDEDGPLVAQEVYTAMFNPPDPSVPFCLARVVDGIARKLREQGVAAERWSTFIHVGA